MRLVVAILLLAVAVGFALHGRLSGLSGLKIAWAPLALAGLVLQYLSPSRGAWPFALLMVSFAVLAVFAARNLAIPGFALILAGLCLNVIVIGLNHGMPVTQRALVASGQQGTLDELINDGGAKHHLAGANDRLLFLGDVTPLAPPVGQIVSAGDVVAYAGVAYVVVAGMRRGRRTGPSLERIPVGTGDVTAGDVTDG